MQEFYWVEEEVSETVPTWYHVVFFEGEGSSVSRSWVKTEGLQKMAEPLEEPKGWTKINGSKRQKMRKTLEMAKPGDYQPSAPAAGEVLLCLPVQGQVGQVC